MKKIVLCLLGIALLAACKPNREKEIAAIEQHEQQLSTIDISTAMMRAADLSLNLGQTEQAIDLLDSIINLYPGFEDLAGCMFLKGYAYESGEMYDEAREAYSQFVNEYPDHYLAQDTKKMLPYIGMSPEAMFEAIMNGANDDNIVQ